MNLADPAPHTFRRSLLCRLALFADAELHAFLGKGVYYNGTGDIQDIFDLWDLGTDETERIDGSITPDEWMLLRAFDRHLDEHYWSRFDSLQGPEWGWLFTSDMAPPPIWHETVSLAQHTLAQFADFDISHWRALGRPTWF